MWYNFGQLCPNHRINTFQYDSKFSSALFTINTFLFQCWSYDGLFQIIRVFSVVYLNLGKQFQNTILRRVISFSNFLYFKDYNSESCNNFSYSPMHYIATLKNKAYLHVISMMSLHVGSFAHWLLISASELQFKLQVHTGL